MNSPSQRYRLPRHIRIDLALGAAIVWLLFAGAMPASAAQCPARPHNHASESTTPLNIGELKLQVLDYLCFGAYERDVAGVLAEARRYVESETGQFTKPALVLDIDETSLSNRTQILANDFGYIPQGPCEHLPDGPCGSRAWELRHDAPAIAPTLDLFDAAKAKGVAIFFISGRNDGGAERSATVANLTSAGYGGWTEIKLRPSGYNSVEAYKTAMRASIEEAGYTIIANIGDQYSDLRGGYAKRVWKLPNPFYYIP